MVSVKDKPGGVDLMVQWLFTGNRQLIRIAVTDSNTTLLAASQ